MVKEIEMEKTLTVRELIAILETMPSDAPVEMTMNGEYQSRVRASMITYEPADGEYYRVPTVVIDDTVSIDD